MSLRTKFFALTYDRQMAKTEMAGLRAFRERLLAGATGDVLEIGGGTGANLSCYGPAVGSLTITEPQPPMLRRLERNVRTHCASRHGPDARVLRAPAEDLPFDDDSFDVAVSTLVLCGVDDQPRALRELRRVLRPGGRLLFIEHVRSGDPGTARLQDRLNWLNRLVVCCDCNRPTLDSILAAGFTAAQVEHTALPKAPPFVRPAILGSATAPAAAPRARPDGVQPHVTPGRLSPARCSIGPAAARHAGRTGRSGPCGPVVSPPEAARLAVVLPAVVFNGPGQGFRLSPLPQIHRQPRSTSLKRGPPQGRGQPRWRSQPAVADHVRKQLTDLGQ